MNVNDIYYGDLVLKRSPEIKEPKGGEQPETATHNKRLDSDSKAPSGYDLLATSPPGNPGVVAEIKPGIYPAMPRATYDDIGYFSQTVLKKWLAMRTEPEDFKYWLDHRTEDEGKECLLLGKALDCRLIDGFKAFQALFFRVPDSEYRRPSHAQRTAKKPSVATVKAIEFWDDVAKQAEGKTIVTPAEFEMVFQMSRALEQSERTEDIFRNCRKVNLIANLDGFPCKSEIDLWMDNSEHIMDLKTCRDVSPKGFWDAFYNYGYLYQATFYLSLATVLGFDKTVFDFVCVKNVPPYTVRVYSFTPETDERHLVLFAEARKELAFAMGGLDVRLKANNFKSPPDWESISVPEWAVRKAQNHEFV